MSEDIATKRGYSAHQFRYAFEHWRADMGGRIPELAVTSAVGLFVGILAGMDRIAQGDLWRGLFAAVAGAVGGPFLLTVGLSLWHYFKAPAAIWREQEAELQRLRDEISARSIVQLKNFGAAGIYHPYLNVSDKRRWPNVLIVRYHYDLINDSGSDAWAYYPKVQILRTQGPQWLPVTVEFKDNTGRMVPKGARLHGLATLEPARYSVLARDGASGEFITYAINFAEFAHQPLRLRLTVDIGGQPPVVVETDLPVVDA